MSLKTILGASLASAIGIITLFLIDEYITRKMKEYKDEDDDSYDSYTEMEVLQNHAIPDDNLYSDTCETPDCNSNLRLQNEDTLPIKNNTIHHLPKERVIFDVFEETESDEEVPELLPN